MKKQSTQQGFTLIELMVVVMIIGILVLIAMPVLKAARENAQKRTCFANERLVEGAYASEIASAGIEAAATMSDWSGLMAALVPTEMSKEPVCPSGGTYTWVDTNVICSKHGTFH